MNKEKNMTFLEHLEILRWHLIRIILYVSGFSIICFVNKGLIFDKILFAPIKTDFFIYELLCSLMKSSGFNSSFCFSESTQYIFDIQNLNMPGQFTMHFYISIIFAFALSFPLIVFEIWKFIKPALYAKELKNSKYFILFSSLFFFTGLIFSYYIIAPLSLQFLGSYQVSGIVENNISLSSYIRSLCSICICIGIVFELPILIYFLTRYNLVSINTFKKYRRYIIVIILILAAIITPPDVISQVLVALPVLLLYESSLIVVKFLNKNK